MQPAGRIVMGHSASRLGLRPPPRLSSGVTGAFSTSIPRQRLPLPLRLRLQDQHQTSPLLQAVRAQKHARQLARVHAHTNAFAQTDEVHPHLPAHASTSPLPAEKAVHEAHDSDFSSARALPSFLAYWRSLGKQTAAELEKVWQYPPYESFYSYSNGFDPYGSAFLHVLRHDVQLCFCLSDTRPLVRPTTQTAPPVKVGDSKCPCHLYGACDGQYAGPCLDQNVLDYYWDHEHAIGPGLIKVRFLNSRTSTVSQDCMSFAQVGGAVVVDTAPPHDDTRGDIGSYSLALRLDDGLSPQGLCKKEMELWLLSNNIIYEPYAPDMKRIGIYGVGKGSVEHGVLNFSAAPSLVRVGQRYAPSSTIRGPKASKSSSIRGQVRQVRATTRLQTGD